MAKFTLDFAADSEEGSDAYDAFIKAIRAKLAVGESIEGVPVLAPHVPPGREPEFFIVNLSYTDRGTTFTVEAQFRTDNLYLVRYRPMGSDGWHELDGNENYTDLTRDARMELDEIPLSSSRIGAAIMTLAGRETDMGLIARAKLTLIFTVAEAARFRDISSLISRSWWNESTPGVCFANRVRSWARLSSAVQRTRNEGHTFDFDGESTQIWEFVGAIQALGIMHLASMASRPRRSIHDMASAPYSTFFRGQPLLEIFYVRINSIDGEAPGQLYGDIIVTDSARTHCIWKREQRKYVEIYPRDSILLEGPSGPLSAADEFYIELDLWDYDSLSRDDSIAKGTIAFNPRGSFAEYDAVRNCEVTGKYGSVMVSYVAITDGLYAQITVVLIDGDGESPADVYGEITANNGHGQSELFRKTNSSEHVDVKPQHDIPLSRTVVAVPTTGTLRVHANLWDHDVISGDDEIAYGSVEFQPLYKRSEKKAITGECGKVEVRVTWM
ncbi:ribosome-inactivating protein [Aspergillus indologenus CBS 114.80]|uniref:Ribosome-inactivating protein n=1 Tax=Aspergillus indologenus CBS 114.80 TaxID=1450541 RepID=A0A2V5HV09_9EURO|nr:ribosome-inactivating protein [Aspergillus indologenus CBS 114.80]